MSRHREQPRGGLALSPVRLLGGFICVDFHIGCAGCSYCLNRRDPVLRDILDRSVHLDLSRVGIEPGKTLSLAASTLPYRKAKVPIRCGHLTDWRYQERETEAFYRLLPRDYPMAVMTRYPLSAAQAGVARGQDNLLVHVTVTPPIPGFEEHAVECEEVVASASSLPRRNVVFMLRPLVTDNDAANRRLVDLLPPKSNVCFHGLSTDSIPAADRASSIAEDELTALKGMAQDRDLTVLDYFGCVLRQNIGRPFFKHWEKRTELSRCAGCTNAATCGSETPCLTQDAIAGETSLLKIVPREIRIERRTVQIQTRTPSARAEEVYLSERLNACVYLSSVTRTGEKGIRSVENDVLERWESTGFFPTFALRGLSEDIRRAI